MRSLLCTLNERCVEHHAWLSSEEIRSALEEGNGIVEPSLPRLWAGQVDHMCLVCLRSLTLYSLEEERIRDADEVMSHW